MVKSWNRAQRIFPANSKFITDVPVLKSLSRLSAEGSAFRSKLGAQWELDLDAILMFARDSKCSSCGSAGRPGRSSLSNYLDDVNYFVTNFNISNGGRGNTFFNWMRGRTNSGASTTLNMDDLITQLDEVHQTIRDLAKRDLKNTDVVAMGSKFDVGKPGISSNQFKEYDLRLIDNIYTEYKNVDFVSNALKNRTQSIDQFINGYLRNIESFDKIQWKAGFDKLRNGWGDIDNALLEMKKQWKTVFEENFDDVVDSILSNSSLKQNSFTGLNDVQIRAALENWVATTDDALYKFIKVE